MKLLVTGGAGFIGSCFIRHILGKGLNYKIFNLLNGNRVNMRNIYIPYLCMY